MEVGHRHLPMGVRDFNKVQMEDLAMRHRLNNYGHEPCVTNSTFASCVILVGGFMLLGPRLW
jgi:hypothetical protein